MSKDEVAAKQEYMKGAANACPPPMTPTGWDQAATASSVLGSRENINIPMEYNFRVKLENRRQQLRQDLEEVNWAMDRLDNPEVRESIRFYDVLNKCK